MAFASPVSYFAAVAPLDEVLRELLAVSLTGVILYTPLYEAAGAGAIVDFRFEYLNPAAQRMMSMPEVPTVTHNQQWPHSREQGTFAFHVDAFVTGEPRQYNINYQLDGYDNYYRLAAQRVGQGLLVSFTDTADQPRSPVEEALREAQAREREARAETEAQRRRLYHMLEQFPAVVASYRGPDHVFDLVSHRFQRDFPTRTIKGRPVREALPELAGQGYYDILDGVYHTGEPFYGTELETWVDLTGTGKLELQYYNVCFQATRDAQGRIDGCLNFAYDVTTEVLARQQVQQLNQELEARVQERTRAALALQADLLAAAQQQANQRALLYQIFEETPAAICIQRGPEHRYEYANAAYQAFFPGRQLLGRTVVEALPETVDSGVVTLLDRVYETGETYFGQELPLLIAQPDGRPPQQMYFTFTYQAIRENGEIVGISTFAHEVAEQVRARQRIESYAAQLQESETRFRTMADAAPNLVWAVHPDSSIRYVNRAFLDFVGLRAEQDYIVTGWGPYIHPEEFELTRQALSHAIAERIPYTLEHRMLRHDGQYRWLLAQGAPSYLSDGELYGYVGSAIDITEFKQVNEQLRRTNVDLDNFIYTASHDLKAPIANIEGLLHTLRRELPAPGQASEVPYILDLMQDSVDRFTRTIEHLTDVSRLQKEHDPPTLAVALAPVMEDVRLDLAPLLAQTGGHLTVNVRAVSTVTFAEKNLRSVIYNLLSNALKYHHPDRPPVVQVRAWVENGYVVLTVQDNGLGFDLSRAGQLFGMFQRLHTHVAGTGVGLYMVKRMVENVGGKITVESEVGVGSTFTVYFPG